MKKSQTHSQKKVLYGIQCTGNGHITRSREIIDMLHKYYGNQISQIDVCLSGDLSQIDTGDLNVVYRFPGLKLAMIDGKISIWETLKSLRPIEFIRSALSLDLNQYEVIVSDFEPVTCWASLLRRRHTLGISNQYKFLSRKILKSLSPNLLFNRSVTKIVCPVDDYISFDYLKEGDRDFFPIIGDVFRRSRSEQGEYYLVYLNTYPLDDLIKFFELFPHQKFHIFSKDCTASYEYENLQVHPIDKGIFAKEMLRCAGVITHGGFQTTAESLYLGKKLAVIPIKRQIEQIYNAKVLSKFGVKILNDLEVSSLNDFFSNDYRVKLNYQEESLRICNKIMNSNGKEKG